MLSLFKNHNMMMPVDFGDNTNTQYPAKPPMQPADAVNPVNHRGGGANGMNAGRYPNPMSPCDLSSPQPESTWDWNKLFVPMQQAMGMNAPTTTPEIKKECNDDFKYSSPFKYASPFKKATPSINDDKPKLNPNAASFKAFNPNLNPNAVSFKMASPMNPTQTQTQIASNDKTMPKTEEIATKKNKKKKSQRNKPKPDYNNDDTILALHGYKKLKKLKDSLQGKIYLGETIRGHDIVKQLNIPKHKKRRVVIKKTFKHLHKERISVQDGMNMVVEENVVKEAIILHHLTVDNSPAGSSICKLLSFFESANAYYIVMEYGGNMNLKQFVDRAHEYIKKGQLDISHWKKICKYLAWQIAATVYWMHTDMNCAHLDLKLENIVINNGNFKEGKDGKITIDRNLSCKICDYGLAEIFKINDNEKDKEYFEYDVDENKLGAFHINNKFGIVHSYQCPQIFAEEVYDSRKADVWSLGVILFYMAFGIYPYKKQVTTDTGFWSVKNEKLDLFLDMNHLSHLYNAKLIALVQACLQFEENQRFDIESVVTDLYFKTYFKRYAEKIKQQSKAQLVKNENDTHKMDTNIPYYKPQQ